MKRFFCVFLLAILLPVFSFADLPDISNLSYDELLLLRDQVNDAIMNSADHQQIELPPGLWAVGIDFPAGTWLVTPLDDQYMNLWYGDKLNDSKTDAGYGWDSINGYNKTMSTKKKKDGSWKDPDYPHSVVIKMSEGWFLKNNGTVILTRSSDRF